MFSRPGPHSEIPYHWRLTYLIVGMGQLLTGTLLFLTSRNNLIFAVGALSLFGLWLFINSLGKKSIGSEYVALGFALCLGFITGGSSNPLWGLSFLPLLLEGTRQKNLRSSLFLLVGLAGWMIAQFTPTTNEAAVTSEITQGIRSLSDLFVILLFWFLGRVFAHERERTHNNWVKNRVVQNQKDKITSQQTLIAALLHKMATPLNVALLEIERATTKNTELEAALSSLEEAEQYLRQINLSFEQNRHSAQEELHAEKTIPRWLAEFGFNTNSKNLFIESGANWRGDLENLKEALFVLLQNAREVNSKDSSEPEVRVFKHNNDFVLQVIDHGPGFNETILKHWGEPYNSSKGSHRGMGLYNVHLFAQAHGGDLTAENLKGTTPSGARVTLRLPEHLEVLP